MKESEIIGVKLVKKYVTIISRYNLLLINLVIFVDYEDDWKILAQHKVTWCFYVLAAMYIWVQ